MVVGCIPPLVAVVVGVVPEVLSPSLVRAKIRKTDLPVIACLLVISAVRRGRQRRHQQRRHYQQDDKSSHVDSLLSGGVNPPSSVLGAPRTLSPCMCPAPPCCRAGDLVRPRMSISRMPYGASAAPDLGPQRTEPSPPTRLLVKS